MKIYINAVTDPQHVIGNLTSDMLAIDINWFFDDGITMGGGEAMQVPWTALSTATSLNNAIKSVAIGLIAAENGYQVNILTDQLFVMCGFLGV